MKGGKRRLSTTYRILAYSWLTKQAQQCTGFKSQSVFPSHFKGRQSKELSFTRVYLKKKKVVQVLEPHLSQPASQGTLFWYNVLLANDLNNH